PAAYGFRVRPSEPPRLTKTRTRVLRCESLTRVADAGCSGAALMARGGNLSLGRIFRTSGSAKFEVRSAGRPVRTARTLAKRGGRGFGERQANRATGARCDHPDPRGWWPTS